LTNILQTQNLRLPSIEDQENISRSLFYSADWLASGAAVYEEPHDR
jgi:hypothetical protein